MSPSYSPFHIGSQYDGYRKPALVCRTLQIFEPSQISSIDGFSPPRLIYTHYINYLYFAPTFVTFCNHQLRVVTVNKRWFFFLLFRLFFHISHFSSPHHPTSRWPHPIKCLQQYILYSSILSPHNYTHNKLSSTRHTHPRRVYLSPYDEQHARPDNYSHTHLST